MLPVRPPHHWRGEARLGLLHEQLGIDVRHHARVEEHPILPPKFLDTMAGAIGTALVYLFIGVAVDDCAVVGREIEGAIGEVVRADIMVCRQQQHGVLTLAVSAEGAHHEELDVLFEGIAIVVDEGGGGEGLGPGKRGRHWQMTG